HQAAELIIGKLNEEGYLIASDEELLGIAPIAAPEADVEVAAKIVGEAEAIGIAVAGALPETSDLEISDLAHEDFAADDTGVSHLTAQGAATDCFVEPSVAAEVAPDIHP